MRFYIYSRKSVYTGVGESVDNQIDMCKSYIYSKFSAPYDITVFEDEGYSAKDTNRPQFKEMIKKLRTERPDFVVCYRLDRISRSVVDFSKLIEELNSRSISFVCIKEEFDTSKPMGKAMMYIASVFSQLERETIAERVRDNMLLLARSGRWLGGTPPLGYKSESIKFTDKNGRQRLFSALVKDENELDTVKTIFSKYLETESLSYVGKYLERERISGRNGVRFSLSGIKQILKNPVYCAADSDAKRYFGEFEVDRRVGLTAYNKRNYRLSGAPKNSMNNWIVAKGHHEPAVSGREWLAVQNLLSRNIPSGKTPSKLHNDYALLSGLIICPVCSGRMFSKKRTGKTADRENFDYICENKLKYSTSFCNSPNLSGNCTDTAVFTALMANISFSDNISKSLKALERSLIKASSEKKEIYEDIFSLSFCEKRRLIRDTVLRITVEDSKTYIFLK